MRAQPESSSDDETAIASLVAGFEHFRPIGAGSRSTVYSATQLQMGRPVAIKVVDTALSSDVDRRAFERECRAMGVLSRHPNIVTVYSDALTFDGRACLVMELYHENYRDLLSTRGPLALDELLLVGVKVAGALQAAHDSGVLHRDIKPHNIFVSDFGEPALGDFGISWMDDERVAMADSGLSVAYAAPEVIEDSDTSFLSDVYSLAATLHHLAAGHPPFAGGTLDGIIRRIMSEEPPLLVRDDVPASLCELLRRGLSKSPEERPDSAGDFAESLRDICVETGLDASKVPLRRSERASVSAASSADAAPSTGHDDITVEAAAVGLEEHDPPAESVRTPKRPGRIGVDVAIFVVVVGLVVYAVLGLT
jgi:serine/threonine protein kinase